MGPTSVPYAPPQMPLTTSGPDIGGPHAPLPPVGAYRHLDKHKPPCVNGTNLCALRASPNAPHNFRPGHWRPARPPTASRSVPTPRQTQTALREWDQPLRLTRLPKCPSQLQARTLVARTPPYRQSERTDPSTNKISQLTMVPTTAPSAPPQMPLTT